MHPLHGNPYSLTLISIDGHLHSPFDTPSWCETIFSFLSSPQPPFYSTYSAISMAHTHILCENWKSLRTLKVWNNSLACHRGCAWFKYFVWWRWSIDRLYDFAGITFFGLIILRRHNCFISMWGSPGLGGVRVAGLYRQPDSWTMKIQDWRLRPVSGWDFPWRGRQAWWCGYSRSPTIVTDFM